MTETLHHSEKHYPFGENGLDVTIINQLAPIVDSAESEVKSIFGSAIPDDQQYAWFNENGAKIPKWAHMHCWAYAPNIVSFAIDRCDYTGESVTQEIREGVFHELVHIVQGYTYVDGDMNMSPNPGYVVQALYEGEASIFERDYARKDKQLPLYADYLQHSDVQLNEWLRLLADPSFSPTSKEWDQWRFYHEGMGIYHIAYKVGAWLADKAMQRSNKTILELIKMDPHNVIKLGNEA